MLHEPTWGFGAEEDSKEEDERGNEGRTKLKAPSDIADVFDDDVGSET